MAEGGLVITDEYKHWY